MKLLTEEHRTKLLANGARRGADHKTVVKWFNPHFPVRPEGADHQWRKVPSRELSVDLVADERGGWVTGRLEAS